MGISVPSFVDLSTTIILFFFYTKAFFALRTSVQQDIERNSRANKSAMVSKASQRKKLLSRAFSLISVCYVLVRLPVSIVYPFMVYFEEKNFQLGRYRETFGRRFLIFSANPPPPPGFQALNFKLRAIIQPATIMSKIAGSSEGVKGGNVYAL